MRERLAAGQHERATAARYLGRRGLEASADTTLWVSGAQHGLATAAIERRAG